MISISGCLVPQSNSGNGMRRSRRTRWTPRSIMTLLKASWKSISEWEIGQDSARSVNHAATWSLSRPLSEASGMAAILSTSARNRRAPHVHGRMPRDN